MYPASVQHTAHVTAPAIAGQLIAGQSPAVHAPTRATPSGGPDEHLPINQVLHGNCVDVLAGLPASSAAFCLTDPPYLVGYRDRSGRSIAGDLLGDAPVIGAAFAEVFRVLAPDSICVSFYGWNRTDLFFDAWKRAGFRVAGHVTFPKRYHSGSRLMRYTHEGAYVLAKGQPQPPQYPIADVIDWGVASGNKLHPTQKPTQILTPLIESFCPPGGVVLDPFAGSGSTCVAALSVGRRFVGIEMDDRFHQVACRRLANYGRRMAMGLGFALDHVPAGADAPTAAH